MLTKGIFNVIYVIATTHQFGGWLILLAGIYAVLSTFKARKACKDAGGDN